MWRWMSVAWAALSLSCASAQELSGPTRLAFQQLLADSTAANGVIGAQAVVLIPGHEAWIGVVGEDRPGSPMRPDLLIGTGSITKMYTAVAALLLIGDGALRFDDTVGTWFPDVPNVDPGITIEQLLQHTAGLEEYGLHPDFAGAIFGDTSRFWTPAEMLAFIPPPAFRPGAAWQASNTNRLLLALIVERVSGRSFPAFMRERVFAGSPGSWMAGDGAVPAAMASQWIVDPGGTRRLANDAAFSTSRLSALREIFATALDVARFGQRVFAGDLLTSEVRAAMLRTVPDDGRIAGQIGGGLGIREYDYLGRHLYGHSGATGYDSSLMLFDPATGIVVAVAFNQGGGHGNAHFRLAPALLEAAIQASTARTGL